MSSLKKQKSEVNRRPTGPPRSRLRTWIFRILSIVLIPLVFFGGLELILRLCGVGYPTGIAVPCKRQGRPAYTHNIKFGWRFFPPRIARQFDGFVLDAEKSPDTFRIFILGESAAAGMPASEYNFGRILEVMLNEACPGTRFEVITAAMPAINSHVLVDAAADCARLEPDLFVLYMGNNEVVGPFGPGTVFAPLSPSRTAIRLHIAVKKTRIGQMLDRLVQAVTPASKSPQRWGGLAMFLDKQVRSGSPPLETAYRHFESNVSEICRIARGSGAAVVISSVGCNLRDCAPFASLHREDLSDSEKQQWEEIYQKGIEREEAGDLSGAAELYNQASQIDPTFADLQFRMGRCTDQAGDPNGAGVYYRSALEYDTVRLRADDRIHAILRAAAEGKEGIYFADTVSVLEENAPGRTPGEEFFYEHVHFNFNGNYLTARSIFSRIWEILPDSKKPDSPVLLDREECARRLAYTGFEQAILWEPIVNEMLDEPPFTGQLYHERTMEKVRQRLQALGVWLEPARLRESQLIYEQALLRKPDDWQLHWRYSIFLKRAIHDYQAEEKHLRTAMELCPLNASLYLNLGRNLHRQGRFREAQEVLYEFLKIKPTSAEAHVELAKIYRTRRDNENYIRHLSAGISLAPAVSVDPYRALAEVYFITGRPDQAIGTLRRAIRIFPEAKTAEVHAHLGYLLISQGQHEKAYSELKRAVEIDPNYTKDERFQKTFTELENRFKP